MDADPDAGAAGRVTIICAWCGMVLQDGDPEPVSHGLCDVCLPLLVESVEQRLSESPNRSLPGPGSQPAGDP